MTFLEGIDDAAALTRSDLASLVGQGLRNGLSGNSMLASARDVGLGIRRENFLQLVGEVRASIANETGIQALGANETADESLITPWTGGATDTYLHRVEMYVRDRSTGTLEVMKEYFDIKSSTVLSPAEAQARAQEFWQQGLADPEKYPKELLGTSLMNIFHSLGRQ